MSERNSPLNPTQGLLDVVAERERQIYGEGYRRDHDDGQRFGTLARAAAYFIGTAIGATRLTAGMWPMDEPPRAKDPRRDLVRAAALLLAEIERFDRVGGPPDDDGWDGVERRLATRRIQARNERDG